MAPELHLFILWQNALEKANAIITDMQSRFTIRRVFAVHWSEQHFSNNMSRFYGQKLPRDSFKEVHCGRGPFLAVLLIDEQPNYELRETSRGTRVVNAKCFDAKESYRQLTGGGHRVHGTNSPEETGHDLALLLHQTSSEFLDANPGPWDGTVTDIEHDLAGAEGWNSLTDLFQVLNASIEYAVLRNFEGLPESATIHGHGDIDLLCSSTREMAFIANANRVYAEPYRVLHRVKVCGTPMLFDFREVGSSYYDPAWEKDMLERRVFSPKGFFHLGPEDHFHSLLYHAAVHKPAIAPDYIARLRELSSNRFDVSNGREIIDAFFSARGYRFVEPSDLSVHVNSEFVPELKLSTNRILASSRDLGMALVKLFDQTGDCSVAAPDFKATIFRTKALAPYFSLNRAMFLDALPLPKGASILEINAQSGILTRWLGERFNKVTALEPHNRWSEVIQKRCRDLKTVEVRSEIDALPAVRTYDVAIALLDRQVKGPDMPQVSAAIRLARQALKKSGLLILGIDAGKSTAEWRTEVLQQLTSRGFNSVQFFYAFPNVILPRVVFSEEAVRSSRKPFGYWAAFAMRESAIPVDEFETVGASTAGKLDGIATSCYILASRDAASVASLPWQVCAVSSEVRHPDLRATTQVINDGVDLIVQKRGTPRVSGVFDFNPVMDCPLFEGHTLSAGLIYALRTKDLPKFLALLQDYARHLTTEFAFAGGTPYPPLLAEGDTLLRGEALDAVPQNAVMEHNSYRFFDREWRASIPLPLSYVLYRGLSVLFQRAKPSAICKAFELEQYGLSAQRHELARFFINSLRVCAPLGLSAIQHFVAFERRFSAFVDSACVQPQDASLFERYHLAIALHAQGDLEGCARTVAEMKSAYPDAPDPIAIPEVLAL